MLRDRFTAAAAQAAGRFLLLAGLCFILGACSSIKGMIGGEKDVILPGQRETVIATGKKLDVTDISKIAVTLPQVHFNTEWTQPGGVPSNAPEHLALGPQLKRVWRTSIGRGSSSQGRLTAKPIIAQNLVFTLDTRATVRAFTVADGNEVWETSLVPKNEEAEEGFGGGLAYDGGRIFVTTAFGNVVALDARTGKRLWEKKLGIPFRAAPTAAVGRVFVVGINNQVFALSAGDGSTVWKFQNVAESAGLLSSTSPAYADGVVVVPYTTGDLIGFDVETGRPLWTDTLTRTGRLSSLSNLKNIAAQPVIYRGRVMAISNAGRVAGLDLKTGQRLWVRNFSGIQTPWAANDYVFFVNSENILIAISHADGKLRWIKRLGDGEWSGPVLAGNRLLVVNDQGTIRNINPFTGTEISTRDIGAKILIPPVVAGNTIYFLSDEGRLIAMR